MKYFIPFLATMMAVQCICLAEVTRLPSEHRKALQHYSRFRDLSAVCDLPSAIVVLCADGNGRLANPGQPWAITDVGSPNDPYPRNALVWAVTDGNYYVVHYKSGGIVVRCHLVVARLESGHNKPSFLWRCVSDGKEVKDYRAFLNALDSNILRDAFDAN